MIDRGADVNARTDYGWVPLHYAAAPESAAVAELLMKSGASPDAANDDGCTPLHFAVDYGKIQVVKLLLARGANVNAHDNEGRTPLDHTSPSSPIGKFLLGKGAMKGRGAPIAQEESQLPDWLAGKEELIGQVLENANEAWNVPKAEQEAIVQKKREDKQPPVGRKPASERTKKA